MYEGQSEKKSNISHAEEGLYSRDQRDMPITTPLSKKEHVVQEQWEDESETESPKIINAYTKKRNSMIKNILITSLVFFIGALIFAFYMLYGETNVASPDNINMSVVGVPSVDAGEEVELQVLIENKNLTDLLSAELFIDMPDGGRATLGNQEDVSRIVRSLGTIGQNVLINEKFSATFFGEENKEKKIYITLEYRFEGSNATFIKETEHSVLIVSSQVDFTLSVLGEASSGQEVELVVSVDSGTSETLENLMFEMNYPFGFTYIESDLEPIFNDTTWVIETLEPFEKQEIHIRGTISGEDDNSKVFVASLGSRDSQDPRSLETVYSRAEESIIIKRPFIGLQVLIDRQEALEPVIIKGIDKVYVSIPWVNNLDTKIIDMGIEARIKHPIADRSSIIMNEAKGHYSSLDDVIVWDQRTNPEFAEVLSGSSGVVGFTFEVGSIVQGETLLEDVEIEIEAFAKARRLSDVNVTEMIKTPAVGKAKLLTSFDLSSQVLHDDGVLSNTGPIPPKVNQKTTYTIRWQITNGTSDVSNTIVRTSLPTYVSWEGVVSPKDESFIYNEIGGEVIWNAGDIPAGAGVTKAPREFYFQVGLIPSVTQVGGTPILITNTTLTGIDDFTGSIVTDTESARDTKLTTEINFDLSKDSEVTY